MAPSGRELSSKMTEGDRVTNDFSSLPKACGCKFCFDYKIQRLKFFVTRSPSDGFAATFLPEEGNQDNLFFNFS